MEKKRKIREAVNVEYDDGLREAITAKRLSNTDLIGWIDTGFNKSFLVFRSIERADPKERADQSWFDSLTQDSALAVVEKSLALNHSPELQKKILDPAMAVLQSFLLPTQSSFSPPADTGSKT